MNYTLLKEQFFITEKGLRHYENVNLSVEDHIESIGSLATIKRMIVNNGEEPITFIPCISVKTENKITDWFIPSFSYSGNAFGDGMEPKGLTFDGEPWIFPSDHTGIPGCTVVMGENGCSALFLAPCEYRSASSLEVNGDAIIQRAFFTHIEYPKAYLEKFLLGDAVLNAVTLSVGESMTVTAQFFLSTESGTFGYRSFIEYLLTEYTRDPIKRDTPEIYEYSMSFLRGLIERPQGLTLTNVGWYPRQRQVGDKMVTMFVLRANNRYECGWCGQNISNAWLLLWDNLKKTNRTVLNDCEIAPFDMSFMVKGSFDTVSEDYQNAIAILDSWQKYRFPNGLIPVNLDHALKGHTEYTLDLCNLGWFVYQFLNAYVLLKNGGIVRDDYLATARGVLDAVLHYPSLGNGFPQTVNEDGKVLCDLGMAGAMMTVAALQMYRVTGEDKYLAAGKDSFDFYYEKYLSRNAAAGAALDTYCIDKESAGPVLRAALMLEKVIGDGTYLKKAENIACYLQTWMFYYDIPFPEDTDAFQTGFTTLGATAVSAQHHHLDCWASYYAPDLRYLAAITGNKFWHRASDYLREYTFQGISNGKTEFHGLIRPAGAQNEAIFQSSWTFDGKNKKGQFNDWLVSWVNTFRLMDMDHAELVEAQKSQ